MGGLHRRCCLLSRLMAVLVCVCFRAACLMVAAGLTVGSWLPTIITHVTRTSAMTVALPAVHFSTRRRTVHHTGCVILLIARPESVMMWNESASILSAFENKIRSGLVWHTAFGTVCRPTSPQIQRWLFFWTVSKHLCSRSFFFLPVFDL